MLCQQPLNPIEMNVPRDVNTTNLHVHGLHMSPMNDSDNVFRLVWSIFMLRCNLKLIHSVDPARGVSRVSLPVRSGVCMFWLTRFSI